MKSVGIIAMNSKIFLIDHELVEKGHTTFKTPFWPALCAFSVTMLVGLCTTQVCYLLQFYEIVGKSFGNKWLNTAKLYFKKFNLLGWGIMVICHFHLYRIY